ncbi:MAG: serine/threonine-protein kinase [Planctomycetota bacterium]|jgi:FixJ family two-component response regulator
MSDRAAAGSETRQIAAGLRVLVVDDEPHIRALIGRLLDEMGVNTIVTCPDGPQALRSIESERVDVMVLDLNMPVVRGEEVALRTLDRWPSAAIIVVTGDASIEATVELMRAGVLDLLRKPIELRVLRQALRRAIKHAGVAARPTGKSGRQVGRYHVLEETGTGGMGAVYRARDGEAGRIVALKTLRAFNPSPDHQVRFQIESATMARLKHPHIVEVHDIGIHEGTHYLVMDFIDGVDLAELIYRNRLTIGQGIELMAKVADAVGYAHGEGVLHRDLKPSNILVDAQGEPAVIDFGLAKLLNSGMRLTHSDVVIGTFGYLAPERILGGEVDEGVDIYSIGAILYEMFTHRLPYERPDQSDIYPDFTQPAEPVASINPNVPADLEAIVHRAISVERANRHPTAKVLAQELRGFLAANG